MHKTLTCSYMFTNYIHLLGVAKASTLPSSWNTSLGGSPTSSGQDGSSTRSVTNLSIHTIIAT